MLVVYICLLISIYFLHLKCSDGETHQPKEMHSPTRDTTGFLQKEKANPDISNAPSYAEDYVMVPAQFPSKTSERPALAFECYLLL